MPFRDIVGHRRLLSLLSRSIARGTLPPSLIFSGAEGVGKRLAAQAIAQALNCVAPRVASEDAQPPWGVAADPGDGDRTPGGTTPWGVVRGSSINERAPGRGTPWGVPGGLTPWGVAAGLGANDRTPGGLILDACGTCAACKRIARGVHADVQTLVPGDTGSIKIEQVREAIDQTMYRPFEGRRRVAIVEQADALMVPAQNALLKTLEEPPSGSIFILITARPDMLLSTVRSRCPQMRFGRLSATDVAALLERDHGYSRPDALAAAASADGSVRRALDTRAEDFAEARTTAGQLLRDAAGKADARGRLERGKDLLKGGGSGPASSERVLERGPQRGSRVGVPERVLEREHLSVRLEALASILRDLGILATGADARLLANLDFRPQLEGLARAFGSERALRAFTAVDRANEALGRNVSPKVVADWLALQV